MQTWPAKFDVLVTFFKRDILLEIDFTFFIEPLSLYIFSVVQNRVHRNNDWMITTIRVRRNVLLFFLVVMVK